MMPGSRTVLFFPWTHGVGFGYVGRALAIAEVLRDAGDTCVFGADTAEGIVAQAGMRVCTAEGTQGVAVADMGERRGDYIPLDNLDTVYAIARYYHPSRIRRDLQHDLSVIDRVNPDVVVTDMQPTAAVAARHRRLPLLSVADADFLRDEPNGWMPWLPPDEACVLPYPSCVPAFNEVLGALGLPPVADVSDLLWGDLTLVASTPELEASLPPLRRRGELEYVGPVFWDPPWSDVAGLLETFGRDRQHRIYVSLGHGGKFATKQLEVVLEGCADRRWSVFVSMGFRPPADAPQLPPNARTAGFTGIRHPIAWSDLVIHHGGHATTLATLMLGKPAIVLPFMSEQEANGLYFVEQQGAGFLLRKTLREQGRHFSYRLRHSGASLDGRVGADDVRAAVEEIFDDGSFASRARAHASHLRQCVAARSFVDAVDRVSRTTR